MDAVSVIIPAYVRNDTDVKMLNECIDSIPSSYEIVVCDDGSLIDYSIDGVVHVRTEHRGKSHARNTAVEYAHGPLIFPLDADDMLVPGALDALVALWEGIPLYPDLIKFKGAEQKEYTLLDFDCDLIMRKCVSSVNVLHSKEQWAAVGGWDESVEFYEDWEYNARLMSTFCGRHVSKPLVMYRIHPGQSVAAYKRTESWHAANIRAILRRKGVGTMGCCGKHRNSVTSSKSSPKSANTMLSNTAAINPTRTVGHKTVMIPNVTEEGKAVVKYVGGQGMGRHYYRGPKTRYPYKVMHGQIMIVDDRDAVNPGQPGSLFVRVSQAKMPAKSVADKTDDVGGVDENVSVTERKPRQSPPKRATTVDSISISDMTIGEIVAMASSLTPGEAARLLEEEKDGKNRVGAIKVLEKIV